MSARPLSIVVFACSVVALVYLESSSAGYFRVQAVAHAPTVEHPALMETYVAETYVRVGDTVEIGAPLVGLSPYFIDRELVQIAVEIEQVLRESKLAQAKLLVNEERWLSPELRRRPKEPSLQRPTELLFAAELKVLKTRQVQLRADRENLTIVSQSKGRIAQVAASGSSVGIGTSVASITPEFAREIVAYMPPETDPVQIAAGGTANIVRPEMLCNEPSTILRRGAAVEQAPSQLMNLLRLPVHGMPIYLSIPSNCTIAVGQVLSVEFSMASM
jgi:multidrug efflux pump subunit AcrA (membrane-fusion protein)